MGRPSSERMPRVAVAGATGNSGSLAATLVERHPDLTLSMVTSRERAGRWLSEVCPENDLAVKLERFDADRVAERSDVAIVAYPHGEAGPAVAGLRERGVKVVDLSADHRLPPDVYERYYGRDAVSELWQEAAYGLTELNRGKIRSAELVANPGCYATAAVLALEPLRDAIEEVIVDGKSGVSGAGRNADVEEDCKAYATSGHPHIAEITQEIRPDKPVTFVPHYLPTYQGLEVTCYVWLNRELSRADLDELYRGTYDGEPFVRVADGPPGINDVRGTNRCHVFAEVDPETGLVKAFAAIDNLWKGAAGQAVQNVNVMTGRPEVEGLQGRTF